MRTQEEEEEAKEGKTGGGRGKGEGRVQRRRRKQKEGPNEEGNGILSMAEAWPYDKKGYLLYCNEKRRKRWLLKHAGL